MAEYLSRLLSAPMGYPLEVIVSGKTEGGDLRLAIRNVKSGSEAYRLDVTRKSVAITAQAPAGLFYGVQTLRQLLPVDVEQRSLHGNPVHNTFVEYSVSLDGAAFTPVAEIRNDAPLDAAEPFIKSFTGTLPGTPARFVKVRAKNVGECPPWHHGAGGKAWLFVDEIQIN